MIWFLALAGIAAGTVSAYTHYRRRDPDAVDALIRTLRQVVAVLVVIAKAVIGALDVLTRTDRPLVRLTPTRSYWHPDDESDDL